MPLQSSCNKSKRCNWKSRFVKDHGNFRRKSISSDIIKVMVPLCSTYLNAVCLYSPLEQVGKKMTEDENKGMQRGKKLNHLPKTSSTPRLFSPIAHEKGKELKIGGSEWQVLKYLARLSTLKYVAPREWEEEEKTVEKLKLAYVYPCSIQKNKTCRPAFANQYQFTCLWYKECFLFVISDFNLKRNASKFKNCLATFSPSSQSPPIYSYKLLGEFVGKVKKKHTVRRKKKPKNKASQPNKKQLKNFHREDKCKPPAFLSARLKVSWYKERVRHEKFQTWMIHDSSNTVFIIPWRWRMRAHASHRPRHSEIHFPLAFLKLYTANLLSRVSRLWLSLLPPRSSPQHRQQTPYGLVSGRWDWLWSMLSKDGINLCKMFTGLVSRRRGIDCWRW